MKPKESVQGAPPEGEKNAVGEGSNKDKRRKSEEDPRESLEVLAGESPKAREGEIADDIEELMQNRRYSSSLWLERSSGERVSFKPGEYVSFTLKPEWRGSEPIKTLAIVLGMVKEGRTPAKAHVAVFCDKGRLEEYRKFNFPIKVKGEIAVFSASADSLEKLETSND